MPWPRSTAGPRCSPGEKDPKTVPRAAFEVLDSAEQAIGLINDLLDLSRLDEDRLKPVMREVDCGGCGPSRTWPG